MDRSRKSISKRVRALVFSRDGNKCRMCGRSSEECSLEVDHVVPHVVGGTDDLNNLATLCRDCNRGKSDLFLQSLLKKKVELNDLTPIGEDPEKIKEIEGEILEVTDKINNLESDEESKRILGSGMVNQRQFEAMTEKRRIPLIARKEKLLLQRQFLVDKKN